jgi:hypothetical protein
MEEERDGVLEILLASLLAFSMELYLVKSDMPSDAELAVQRKSMNIRNKLQREVWVGLWAM